MLIMGVDRKGPVHILLDEGTFLVDRGDFLGMYPAGETEKNFWNRSGPVASRTITGEGYACVKKVENLLACVVAVTAACAAAWYLLPRPRGRGGLRSPVYQCGRDAGEYYRSDRPEYL